MVEASGAVGRTRGWADSRTVRSEAMFERILLAIDETAAGDVAVSFATAMALGGGSSGRGFDRPDFDGPALHGRATGSSATGRVHVVHANLVLVGGRGVTIETRDQAAGIVTGAVGQLQAAGVEATGEVFTATMFDIASRIVRASEHFGADCLVLGSQRRRRLSRLTGRGVRERLVRATALPVVTAPAPLKVGRKRKGAGEITRLARASAPADLHR